MELVKDYALSVIEFEHLKPVTLAQWMHESGRGFSKLATEHLNFAGLKWREEMVDLASKISYEAHDGTDLYCKFATKAKFLEGYWHFIDRSPYAGWRNHASTGASYIEFVGPRYTPTAGYAGAVLNLLGEAQGLLSSVAGALLSPMDVPATGNPYVKPPIKTFISSPYHSSRNGAIIRRIVLHYTTASNAESTISWFQNNPKSVSAHYIVDKDGDIYQMVHDSERAHHCMGANADTIGIEHVAVTGDHLTVQQQTATVALIKWLVAEYDLDPQRITGHNFTPGYTGSTDCPNVLFGAFSEAAINAWVAQHILEVRTEARTEVRTVLTYCPERLAKPPAMHGLRSILPRDHAVGPPDLMQTHRFS
jgi:hypothetical protein